MRYAATPRETVYRRNHRCPSCGEPHEDRFHLLRCQHTDRVKWTTKFFEDIRQFCARTSVSGEMLHLMVEGLYWSIHDSPLENVQQYPQHLQPLISSQEDIGWEQLFLGRMSTLWQTLHMSHLVHQGYQITKRNSGTFWTASLIRIIWNHIHKVWIYRNEIRHGSSFSEQLEKQRQLCVAEVSMYYDYKSSGKLSSNLPDHIFYPTLQEHLHKESKLSELDGWLSNYRDLILSNVPTPLPTPQNHTHIERLPRNCLQGGSNESSRVVSIT